MSDSILFRILRQDHAGSLPYWQDFQIPYKPGYNVVSALMLIREEPITTRGEKVNPVIWEYNCMEEVCGACAMLINGVPRQACSALIDDLQQPIVLQPLSKFPVIRDLLIDRSRIFEGLKRTKAWIEIDGAWDVHERPPRISPKAWSENYLYSRCMSCGCCMEACPQYDIEGNFLGPAIFGQVLLMNKHPTGRYNREERLHAIMEDGGLSDCGNAQNCVRVCPKEIPLTTAIAELGRQTTTQFIKDIFG